MADRDNDMLCCPVTVSEIKEVTDCMPGDKAPGPDGLPV